MFQYVQNHPIFIKLILGLIVLTFVGFGVGTYTGMSDTTLAVVDGKKIDARDVEEAMHALRQGTSPDMRQRVLEQLIEQRLLTQQANRLALKPSDRALQHMIAAMPLFQKAGVFDPASYQKVLATYGYTAQKFETSMRDDLAAKELLNPLLDSTIVANTQVERVLALLSERRMVSTWLFPTSAFASMSPVEPETVKKRYEQDRARWMTPERVKLEYLVLSPHTLAAQVQVTPAQVRAVFDKNPLQYIEEARQARHILLVTDKKTTATQHAALKVKMRAWRDELQKSPARFAQLATEHSQDAGSAPQGGDLGTVRRGMMVKPFEEALFNLMPGQISDIVQTEFGYHLIQLNGIQRKEFDEVKAQVQADLEKQEAARLFALKSESFKNLVAEQTKQLAPVAAALSIPLKTSAWVTRQHAEEPALADAALRRAVFEADVLQKGWVSEVIESPGPQLVVARVVAHQPSRLLPLTEVEPQIRQQLAQEAAKQRAASAAQEQLLALQQGKPVPLANWSAPQWVTRQNTEPMDRTLLKKIFARDGKQLPAYLTHIMPNGDAMLYRMTQVATTAPTAEQRQSVHQLLQNFVAQAEMRGYQQWLVETLGVTRIPQKSRE